MLSARPLALGGAPPEVGGWRCGAPPGPLGRCEPACSSGPPATPPAVRSPRGGRKGAAEEAPLRGEGEGGGVSSTSQRSAPAFSSVSPNKRVFFFLFYLGANVSASAAEASPCRPADVRTEAALPTPPPWPFQQAGGLGLAGTHRGFSDPLHRFQMLVNLPALFLSALSSRPRASPPSPVRPSSSSN